MHRWRDCLQDLVIVNANSKAPRGKCEKLCLTISHRISGNFSWLGGLLEEGPCRGGPKRGRREAACDISVPDSESAVFEEWKGRNPDLLV